MLRHSTVKPDQSGQYGRIRKSTSEIQPPHKVVKLSAHFCLRRRIWCRPLGARRVSCQNEPIHLLMHPLPVRLLRRRYSASIRRPLQAPTVSRILICGLLSPVIGTFIAIGRRTGSVGIFNPRRSQHRRRPLMLRHLSPWRPGAMTCSNRCFLVSPQNSHKAFTHNRNKGKRNKTVSPLIQSRRHKPFLQGPQNPTGQRGGSGRALRRLRRQPVPPAPRKAISRSGLPPTRRQTWRSVKRCSRIS
jgi:hypothetical protein